MTYRAEISSEIPYPSDICRLCVQEDECLWNIFDASDSNGTLKLPEKIESCLNISVQANDGLPDLICLKCMTIVRCFYDFREQCLHYDCMLRKSHSPLNVQSPLQEKTSLPESSSVTPGGDDNNQSLSSAEGVCSLTPVRDPLEQLQWTGDGTPRERAKKIQSVSPVRITVTPDLARQLEDEWTETIPSDFLSETPVPRNEVTPWRTKLVASTKETECDHYNVPLQSTIDDKRNIFSSCVSEKESPSEKCNNNVPESLDKEENELSFLVPPTTVGEKTILDSINSESESFEIEQIHDDYEPKEEAEVLDFDIFAGRIKYNIAGQWVCCLCNHQERYIGRLRSHMLLHDPNKKQHHCPECPAAFETTESLGLHLVKHATSSLILGHSCIHCYKSFRLKHLLEKHLSSEHSTCKPCVRKPVPKKFRETCGRCVRVFYSSLEMENHDESCAEGVEGRESEEESSESEILSETEESSLSKPPPKIYSTKCYVCKLNFPSIEKLRIHFEDAHKGLKPLKCPNIGCERTYDYPSKLYKHRKDYCNIKHIRNHVCHVCEKSYIHKYKLDDHLRTHTGERPFKCDLCNKCFHSTDNLKHHQRNHFNEKHLCEECGAKLSTRRDLLNHQKAKHSNEKPIMCELCGAMYSCENALRCHQKKHIKNIPCTDRGKVCATKRSWNEHQATHSML